MGGEERIRRCRTAVIRHRASSFGRGNKMILDAAQFLGPAFTTAPVLYRRSNVRVVQLARPVLSKFGQSHRGYFALLLTALPAPNVSFGRIPSVLRSSTHAPRPPQGSGQDIVTLQMRALEGDWAGVQIERSTRLPTNRNNVSCSGLTFSCERNSPIPTAETLPLEASLDSCTTYTCPSRSGTETNRPR